MASFSRDFSYTDKLKTKHLKQKYILLEALEQLLIIGGIVFKKYFAFLTNAINS